eukprot:scaffold11429_cov48-Cyclotella_meneghiniana.AAC.2
MNKPDSNTNCSSNNLRVGNHWSHSKWRLRSGPKRTREQSSASSEGDKETSSSLKKVGNESVKNLNELADQLKYRIRALVPDQKDIITREQELYNQAITMFEGVLANEKQRICLFNILMGVENSQYPFTVHDIVNYHLIFTAAIELAQGSLEHTHRPKKRISKQGLRRELRDEYYKTYLRPTVQCAWNCALASMGCTAVELRDIIGMNVMMVMNDEDLDCERRLNVRCIVFRHITFPDLCRYLCDFVRHCRVKTQSRIKTTLLKWQEFEGIILDREEEVEQRSSSESECTILVPSANDDDEVAEDENPNLVSPIVGQSMLRRTPVELSRNNISPEATDNDEMAGASVADGSKDELSCNISPGATDNDEMSGASVADSSNVNDDSEATLRVLSSMTREGVENMMRDYNTEGLDGKDRNFDCLIDILSTKALLDSFGMISITQAEWTILRNSTLFCSMFFSTLMR